MLHNGREVCRMVWCLIENVTPLGEGLHEGESAGGDDGGGVAKIARVRGYLAGGVGGHNEHQQDQCGD